MSFQLGVYNWSYAGGVFSVSFRPNGIFHCASFPAAATWQVEGAKLMVDWKKYGTYEFALNGGSLIEGSATNAPANWRKLEYLRDFNATEKVRTHTPFSFFGVLSLLLLID
jgi:hypothetical protein